jgi:hypothetical protein
VDERAIQQQAADGGRQNDEEVPRPGNHG